MYNALITPGFCFLSLLGSAYTVVAEDDSKFYVVGTVYCDTCRTQFITRVSELMAKAKVKLECREQEDGKVTYTVEGETDKLGVYHLLVEGDHEEEVCEVVLVESSDPDCCELDKKSHQISLTKENGISSENRIANPLGFMRKEPLAECPEVLKELGITDQDIAVV
ncbi:hypothetical protein LWI28_009180 [Acer negundo]|uniref:Olee1-like protein n=1 Tax=Acer negundo TaxID=4023 RepID=A0AAD5JSN4_ACENE|nr:hypothetical protein LWI28_009180 [Acer negundo]